MYVGDGQPSAIVKSLLPVWNNFVFFAVNAVSFHQVITIWPLTLKFECVLISALVKILINDIC